MHSSLISRNNLIKYGYFAFLWRRKWQPTPVFLPEKSHGQRHLAGNSPWVAKKLDMTWQLTTKLCFYHVLKMTNGKSIPTAARLVDLGSFHKLSNSVFRLYLLYLLLDNQGRKQWHPTPVLLPGKSHGWRSLIGCSPWGR